jgi:hypothetical protein
LSFATKLQHFYNTFVAINQKEKNMADKIKSSYKFSKSFYDRAEKTSDCAMQSIAK